MVDKKTNEELQREIDDHVLVDNIIKTGHTLWAEHRVQEIVYGAVRIILIAVFAALVGLVVYATK
jgi:hypothetical protein